MKRILASCVLAGLIVAISVGCGGDASKPATPSKSATPPAGGPPKMEGKDKGTEKPK